MAQTPEDSLRLICGNRNYSSWSLRAWLCLRRAGLAPELVVLPMDTPEFARRIGDYSPTARVPVLWMGDEFVWDSLAIAETVNERFAGGTLWPAEPEFRARARAMVAEMHSGFGALRQQLPMNCRAQQRRITIDAAAQADVARIGALWSEARAMAGGHGPWLLGEWSIADAFFAPVALRFDAYALDLPETVRSYVNQWLEDSDLRAWRQAGIEEPWVIEHEEVGE